MMPMLLPTLLGVVLGASHSTPAAPDSAALAELLGTFLAGASRDDPAVHERFWDDDLIYTGSSGRRTGKAEILHDVRSATPPRPGEPTTRYTAEDVRIRQYGDAALVAFRLVATTAQGDSSRVERYLNTGFFVRRPDGWRAVGWQATKTP